MTQKTYSIWDILTQSFFWGRQKEEDEKLRAAKQRGKKNGQYFDTRSGGARLHEGEGKGRDGGGKRVESFAKDDVIHFVRFFE